MDYQTKIKHLYKFNVTSEVEVDKIETKVEDGKEITVKTKVKEPKDIQFLIKKPSRIEREEAEIERARFLAEFIKRGVMPEAILSKTYSDQGGLLDEHQKKLYLLLKTELFEATQEYQRLVTEKNEDGIKGALEKIINKQNEIANFQFQQNTFFENTAEFKAKAKLIEYLLVHLTYWREDTSKDYVPYFKGETFEEKMAYLDGLEEGDDKTFAAMRNTVLFVVSAYLQMGSSSTPDEIEKVVNEYTKGE